MNIRNYDNVFKANSSFQQIHPSMPSDHFTMLICGPPNCGKTNLVLHMLLEPLLYFDELYIYAKNLHQEKYQYLQKKFEEISELRNIRNPARFSTEIIPVSQLENNDRQRVVIFDDYIFDKNQKIVDNFTQGRHKNCSTIYLSQSYFDTDGTIRLLSTRLCLFQFKSTREINTILREHQVKQEDYSVATAIKHGFLYIDHKKNKVLKSLEDK